jgi:FkbM family methyltransferase
VNRLSQVTRYAKRAPELVAAMRQTPAWWQVASRYLGFHSADYPFRIPLPHDGWMSTDSPEELKVFWHVFVRRCYRLPRQCDTIIDAGANIGLFSVWAAREAPSARIIAVEPAPSTFQRLCRAIRVNRVEDRIEPLQLGLAAETGERTMRVGAESPRRALVLQGAEVPADEKTIAVRCVSLAELLAQHELDSVDLLKMDIEGAEWEVLLSSTRSVLSRVRHLELEYHEVNARYGHTPEKLFAHLATAGHRLMRREEDAFRTGLASFRQERAD